MIKLVSIINQQQLKLVYIQKIKIIVKIKIKYKLKTKINSVTVSQDAYKNVRKNCKFV